MKLFFIGDIVGRPGREIVTRGARVLARRYGAPKDLDDYVWKAQLSA